MSKFVYLSQEDVVAAGGTDMPAMVDVIERAFRVKAAGEVRMPPKVMITWADEPGTEEKHGRIMAMPAYVGGEFDVAGLKWIPSVPSNPERHGLPRANALVLLTDPATGLPLAVMDGTVVSAMRTGAVTGVAVRHLADPGAEVACLLGAGVLAHTQLAALRTVLGRLREVRVYDPAAERCARFCARARSQTRPRRAPGGLGRGGGPRRRGGRPGDDGRRSDVRGGLDRPGRHRGARVEPGCAARPARRDGSPGGGRLGARVDPPRPLRRAAGAPPGCSRPTARAHASSPTSSRGATRVARIRRQRIVVTPVGLAMDDVAAAWHVLQGARSRGLGTALALRSGPPVWE